MMSTFDFNLVQVTILTYLKICNFLMFYNDLQILRSYVKFFNSLKN